MSKQISSVRGMRTLYGEEALRFERLLNLIAEVLQQYAYTPMSLPYLEKTSLFQRAVGEETDVVSKEMYTFLDRNEESVTLRPEATAGVVRSMIELGLLQQLPQRVYASGAMFRYERPQKGRYRQFHQVSVEAFGSASPSLDVELITLAETVFERLGIRPYIQLELNTIGLAAERKRYQEALVAYLQQHESALDEDSQRRLHSNPLRILDSKIEATQALLHDAPILDDYLGAESRAHFAEVCRLLDTLNIPYQRNPRLVRGLDYYNHTVMEWTTQALGAQGTVCAGGRYDGLVAQLGGSDTPAAGFAFGVDRIALMCAELEALQGAALDVYAFSTENTYHADLFKVLHELRAQGLRVHFQTECQSLKKQLAKAAKSGARYALFIAESEAAQGLLALKDLSTGQQEALPAAGLSAWIQGAQHD